MASQKLNNTAFAANLASLDAAIATVNTNIANLYALYNVTSGVKVKTKTPVEVTQTPTVTNNGIYIAGDALGGLLTFAGAVSAAGQSARIKKIVLLDKTALAVATDLFLFNASVTATADNDAYAPSAADLLKCIGAVNIPAANYFNAGANGKVAVVTTDIPFYIAGGTSLFGQMVTRGTPTYLATNAVVITLHIELD